MTVIEPKPAMNPPNETQLRDTLPRAAAEKLLDDAPLTGCPAYPAAEVLHEQQGHQVEPERQNEAVRQAPSASEASRDRYLYKIAAIGQKSPEQWNAEVS